MKKALILLGLFLCFLNRINAQNNSWKFAHVSDTHIGNATSVEDLYRTVEDINANAELKFVIISGDITEFGADEELQTAKNILNKLNKPWYIIPGNHDMNWSESGGNSFKKIFGAETFSFNYNGYLFLGTNCGPNMRMSPGQVPRENMVWLDSVLKATPLQTPLIYINHYPQDSSLNNWFEIIDRLKTHNIQLILCGHGHSNHHLNFEDIPGIMGRSNLRAKDTVGGYNIVTIAGDSVYYNERLPAIITKSTWTKDRLYNHHFDLNHHYPRPSYTANKRFTQVKTIWNVQDSSDIGAGTALSGDKAIIVNTAGYIKAYDTANGKVKWWFKTGGKIYSTPCIWQNFVAVACTDNYLYVLNKNSGKLIWKARSAKPLVASPVIDNGSVFCGSSDGHFRNFDVISGKLIWDFNGVAGFVVTRPLLYQNMVIFGSWGNQLYALNEKTGSLIWNWTNGSTNRMFSPASCVPVATGKRLFIVAPDRYMTCLNVQTGKVIWRKADPAIKVRESMGLSADSTLVYVKTMDGDVMGMSTTSDTMDVKWKSTYNMGYDISPSVIEEHDGLVFALSNSGSIYAYHRKDGSLAWIHKFSNCLVNPLSFGSGHRLIATSMDGKVNSLAY